MFQLQFELSYAITQNYFIAGNTNYGERADLAAGGEHHFVYYGYGFT